VKCVIAAFNKRLTHVEYGCVQPLTALMDVVNPPGSDTTPWGDVCVSDDGSA